VVLRPGPVIRNEWRNGGYPAWLLIRPEYRMPLRDVLEGRYPATATLQNQRSDAAASEWLHNSTHLRYAARWLDRVYEAVAPWRSDILAIALDDDQGAYLDNDTWPAPHFHRYIAWLASIARRRLPGVPVFINTYQMKVTASAPVWAWGNWYQSDAYSIGEHDRAQLEFSAGLLQTQPRALPLMMSEFQAGWLQGAAEPAPRPADPSNTTLALHTLLQMGAHGVVNFPVQDTFDPAGWEAPWANAFYSWDAALSLQLTPQARYAPTADFGRLIAQYGSPLTRTHPAADAAIAYLASAYDPSRITNAEIARIADATISAQKGCRIVRITCAIVDLSYATQAQLARFPVLIVPVAIADPLLPHIRSTLAAYHGRIVAGARNARIAHPAAGGIPNAVLLVSDDERFGFLDVVNYSYRTSESDPARVRFGRFSADVPRLSVPARSALFLPLGVAPMPAKLPGRRSQNGGGVPLRAGSYVPETLPARQGVSAADVFGDGSLDTIFTTRTMRLIVTPCAGARAFVFEDLREEQNLFTTVGGLRDAWSLRLPPSSRDYIAPYTHPIPAGTFNRCYRVTRGLRSATFTYDAPDAPPHGGTFRKTIAIAADGTLTERLNATFPSGGAQRPQQLTSIAVSRSTVVIARRGAAGFYDPQRGQLFAVLWPSGDASVTIDRHASDALMTFTYRAARDCELRFAVLHAAGAREAQAELATLANRGQSP
jgi:hypothetical protein